VGTHSCGCLWMNSKCTFCKFSFLWRIWLSKLAVESHTSLQENEFSTEQALLYWSHYIRQCIMSHHVEKLHSGHRRNILYPQFTVLLHFSHKYAVYMKDYGVKEILMSLHTVKTEVRCKCMASYMHCLCEMEQICVGGKCVICYSGCFWGLWSELQVLWQHCTSHGVAFCSTSCEGHAYPTDWLPLQFCPC
jgi:hypothetical protein